jgi:hypothetical protein
MSNSHNPNPNYRTSICKYANIGCKQQERCWYAHNKEELRQRFCVKGENCMDKNECCYLHPNQNLSKDQYFIKTLLKSEVIGINKILLKNQLESLSNRFLIELDFIDLEEFESEDSSSESNENNESNELNKNNENDKELENYISNFTSEWNTNPNQFYDMKESEKINITLNINGNDIEIERLLKYLKMMNIEYSLEK